MKNTFEAIYDIVRQIPKGCVTTYGTVAALVGNPRLSRVVGYAMQACDDPSVPCHRVLYRDGALSPAFIENGINRQKTLLKEENVPFLLNGKVDLSHCLWP